jgi:hypothetical protein
MAGSWMQEWSRGISAYRRVYLRVITVRISLLKRRRTARRPPYESGIFLLQRSYRPATIFLPAGEPVLLTAEIYDPNSASTCTDGTIIKKRYSVDAFFD